MWISVYFPLKQTCKLAREKIFAVWRRRLWDAIGTSEKIQCQFTCVNEVSFDVFTEFLAQRVDVLWPKIVSGATEVAFAVLKV